MNNIKWNLQPEGEGKVRIVVESLSKLPTLEDYRKYIERLLKEGKSNNDRKLLDENNSAFIGDNMLLSQELLKMDYKEVVFSTSDGDKVVNLENLDEIFDSLKAKQVNKKTEENLESIEHAVGELFERG
ncbi:MAG: hypothetical protein IJE59_01655 [Clostridia bacterium]|nr:hypothetical protein [Clostridia bacterium]